MSNLALICVRRSMVRYEGDRASPERQLASCVKVCEEKGWSYEVYQDAEGHLWGRSEAKSGKRGMGKLVLRKRRARRDSNPRSHRFEVCGSIH